MNTINTGNTIKVIRRRLPQWYNCLVGMEGDVYEVDSTATTPWEKKNHPEKKLRVRAINYGPLMLMRNGLEKMVYSWEPGNICALYEDEVIRIETHIKKDHGIKNQSFTF